MDCAVEIGPGARGKRVKTFSKEISTFQQFLHTIPAYVSFEVDHVHPADRFPVMQYAGC
jgi:hypothetical protein